MNRKFPVDEHGRSFKKLRVSLLDACNYRCTYCMPDEKVKFTPRSDWMSGDQIFEAVSMLSRAGLEEVRVTGGEPTLRSDFVEIMKKLSKVNLKKLGLTTNAHLLLEHLEELKVSTSLTSINISLDSLDREKFKQITRVDGLTNVLAAIVKAKKLGFDVKINTVLINGFNDNEIIDFIEFGHKYNIHVRFLELMNIGVMKKHHHHYFLSADTVIEKVSQHYKMEPMNDAKDSTSFNFKLGTGSLIGFIASESKPFCGGCSRLRLSPQGEIRPCIMLPESISVSEMNSDNIDSFLEQLLESKPFDRIESQSDLMYQIGG